MQALFLIHHNHGFLSVSINHPWMRLGRQCSHRHLYGPKLHNDTAFSSSLPNDSTILERSGDPFAMTAWKLNPNETVVIENRRECNSDIRTSHLGAIKQVYAIIELSVQGSGLLHNNIMSSSVEGLIRKVYSEEHVDGEILRHLDALVCRCFEYQSVPARSSMRTLWLLHLCHLQNTPFDVCPDEKIEAATRLLLLWMAHSQTTDCLLPPPAAYCRELFMFVGDRNATMTTSLWDLYASHRELNPDRTFFETILDILSSSREEAWETRQCTVLQDMYRLQGARINSHLDPTVAELESAFWAASRHGYVQQATWLYRLLTEAMAPSRDLNTIYTRAWFLSFCICKTEGCNLYLERLLEQIRFEDPSSPINSREYYNLVLRKLAISKKIGSGMRAEKLYKRMLTIFEETQEEKWSPDFESVRYVCLAYLNEDSYNPWSSQEAFRILRQKSKP